MYITQQMECFNSAYVKSMAAHAALKVTESRVDDESVDLMLGGTGYAGKIRNPQLHLQLKSTASPKWAGGMLKFDLNLKNYEDLRDVKVLSPKYLVVMVLPTTVDDWIVDGTDYMSLFNCCYWLSLRGAPPTLNSTKITVDVPMTQRLTTDVLRRMTILASNRKSA